MNEFLKMDVFFFTTTVSVVVFSILGVVVFVKVSRILKNIEHISQQISLESDNVRHDLAEVRDDIRRGKGKLKSLWGLFGKISKRASKK